MSSFEVRPIGARALKSASDTLRPFLASAKIADLFCGQGRFGRMALEEGAEQVDFVDLTRKHFESLKPPHGVPGVWSLHAVDVFRFLSRAPTPYDIVFADPPFPLWNENFALELVRAVEPNLSKDAIFLVKAPTKMVASFTFSKLKLWKESVFGESRLIYLKYGEGN